MIEYIVEDRDGFYYWSDQDELIGPFKTKQHCEVAHNAASRWEAKDHQPEIRKMRENMGS